MPACCIQYVRNNCTALIFLFVLVVHSLLLLSYSTTRRNYGSPLNYVHYRISPAGTSQTSQNRSCAAFPSAHRTEPEQPARVLADRSAPHSSPRDCHCLPFVR